MKRLSFLLVALVFAGGFAAGCSKTAEVATPAVPNVNVNTGEIAGDASKCAELASSYPLLITSVSTGADPAKVKSDLEELKTKVPDAVDAKLTTIQDGLAKTDGQLAALEYMATPEFTAANDAVTKYLTVECMQVGK
jgi:hypothetical protein